MAHPGAGSGGGTGLSLVTDYGEHGSSCGYCGSKAPSSLSHGMMADSMSAECYQELLDRGWRRSGRWLYYPLHDRSCCQLLTIRLDVARFTPNKEQRRVRRRWQAYLEGAPMRPQQEQGQQPPPQQQQQEQGQQQEQLGAATGGEHLEHQRWAPAGGSPKRPHDELADGVLACLAPHSRAGSGEENGGGWEAGEGGGKRHRHVDGGGGELRDGAAGRAPRGASPTAQLRNHLQQALHGNLLHTGGHAFQPQEWQQEAQQQQPDQQPAPQAAAAAAEAAGAGEARLAGQLAAALQQAVAAGLLPPAAYPPPKVQPPTAKQRKLLPAGVACTSAYPLAVAAAASKAAGSRRSPEEVAALLLQQLPAEVAAAAQAAKGHLNFGASVAGPEAAEAEMGDAAAAAAAAAATAPAAAAAAAPAGLAQPTAAYPSTQLASKPLQQQVQAPAAGGAGAAASAAAAAAAAAVASAARAAAAAVPRGVPRHFELRTLPSSEPSLEGVEFQLFKKYQIVHHGDKPSEVTPRSFRRFLIDTPLRHAGPEQYPPGGCPSIGFGSFHQQYWLDGRLVAVGVVDVLPRCLSSKYLFWEPDLAPLSLGKLTSLQEIEWVWEQQAACPSLRYYYLGFYIHNCHRMRYKGDFGPSDLLCPKNKCWVPLARVQAALDQPGMVAISELPGALEGLGEEHRVDAATGHPTCPPREPSEAELDAFRFLVKLPGGGGPRGQPQARVVTLKLLRQVGMLGPAADRALVEPLKTWWSRAGAAAASTAAFALE